MATCRRASRWAPAALAILLSGCAYTGNLRDYVHNGFKVGPQYRKPAAPVADQWIDVYDERVRTELPDVPDWWTVFNDARLTELVYGAYQQNLPLRVAGLRVLEARAQRGIAIGSIFPQSQFLSGSYTRNQLSRQTFPGNIPGSPRAASVWNNGIGAAWELDLWGKFRRNIEAADASLDATIESYDEILICLIADTASAYVRYRVVQQQLRYARANVKIQEGALDIAEARAKSGESSKLDVTQATVNLRNTRQLIPTLENQLRLVNNNLCILLGVPPRDLSPELGDGPVPLAPRDVAVGVPANLLRRRPDVLRAEREAAAQSARIGVAVADWFPSFSISGFLGYSAPALSGLYTQQANTGTITPGFSLPILNYGRILNNVRVQDARFQQAAVNYQQAVLSASTEAENAINTFLKSQETLVEARAGVEAARESVRLAIAQYRSGATDYNRVFNLLLILVSEQNNLAAIEGSIPVSLINIYKSLGGGWQIRNGIPPRAPQAPLPLMIGEPVPVEGEQIPEPPMVPTVPSQDIPKPPLPPVPSDDAAPN